MASYALLLTIFLVSHQYGVLCAEDPTDEEVSQFKNLMSDWSATASRIIRSLRNAPSNDADQVGQQLKAAIDEAHVQRTKRDTTESSTAGSENLQSFLVNMNEGLKNLMQNVSSSPLYKEMQKISDSLQEKGKEWAGKAEEQLKTMMDKTKETKA